MSTVEKRRRNLTVERILPCLELSRTSCHFCSMVISAGLMMLSMSTTHWWFFYLEASPANTLCSACDSHSHSRAPLGKLCSTVVPQLLLDLWNHQSEVATFCYSLSWATAVVCAGCSQWPHLMGPHSVFLQLLLLVLLLLLAVRHSLIQKNLKHSYRKSGSWPHRTADAESRSEKAACRVTSSTGHYTRGKLGAFFLCGRGKRVI